MSKSNALETGYLGLLFNATAIADIAENDASAPLANLFAALHSLWPAEGAAQNSNEMVYGGYARVQIARTSGGFTVSGSNVNPVANVDFPQCSSGSDTARFFSIGSLVSGAGVIYYRGVIGAAAPRVANGAAVNNTVTSYGHGLAVNDRVVFFTFGGSTLPAGIVEGTEYFVRTVPDADNITLSATQGGAELDITANGGGVWQRIQPIAISTNVIPRLTTATTISED